MPAKTASATAPGLLSSTSQHDEAAGYAHQRDELADGEIEAAGEQREHLPGRENREVAALLENVDGVLARVERGLDEAEAEIHQRDDDGQRAVKDDMNWRSAVRGRLPSDLGRRVNAVIGRVP